MGNKTPASEKERRLVEIDTLIDKISFSLSSSKGRDLITSEYVLKHVLHLCDLVEDNNRKAIATMVMGRTVYMQARFNDALQFHKEATRIWKFECNEYKPDKLSYEYNFVYMLKAMSC